MRRGKGAVFDAAEDFDLGEVAAGDGVGLPFFQLAWEPKVIRVVAAAGAVAADTAVMHRAVEPLPERGLVGRLGFFRPERQDLGTGERMWSVFQLSSQNTGRPSVAGAGAGWTGGRTGAGVGGTVDAMSG